MEQVAGKLEISKCQYNEFEKRIDISAALYSLQRMFSYTWSISTDHSHLIFVAFAKPILFFGTLLW